jgi:hypothetical protein
MYSLISRRPKVRGRRHGAPPFSRIGEIFFAFAPPRYRTREQTRSLLVWHGRHPSMQRWRGRETRGGVDAQQLHSVGGGPASCDCVRREIRDDREEEVVSFLLVSSRPFFLYHSLPLSVDAAVVICSQPPLRSQQRASLLCLHNDNHTPKVKKKPLLNTAN